MVFKIILSLLSARLVCSLHLYVGFTTQGLLSIGRMATPMRTKVVKKKQQNKLLPNLFAPLFKQTIGAT